MNKIKLFAAIAIVATLTTFTASCEQTQTPEQMQLAKRNAIEFNKNLLDSVLKTDEKELDDSIKIMEKNSQRKWTESEIKSSKKMMAFDKIKNKRK